MESPLFKVTGKQIKKGEVTFFEIKEVFKKLQIDTAHRLVLAKKAKKIKLPGSQELNELCISKTGQGIREFFDFKLSNTKPKSADRLIQHDFIDKLKKWCTDNSISCQGDYTAYKGRPKEFPTTATIKSNYGEDYFTEVLGLKKYKDTIEDRLHSQDFINELIQWCKENNITSVSQFAKSKNRPSHFPSAERIRQIYGSEYFEEAIGIEIQKYEYLSLEEARKVCIENGVFSSTDYPAFYQQYNLTNKIKLTSDPYRFYNTNWTEFINLSPTQLFIGKNMSNLELFTYKVLYDRNLDFETEKTFPDCRNKKPLPFDFYLPHCNTLIELDGSQHSTGDESNLYFSHSIKINDEIKNKYAIQKGIRLLRINRLIDIIPTLNAEIGLQDFPKVKELDWTLDFQSDDEIINSKFSKRLKVKLLLLMAERGKSTLTNVEIIKATKCAKPTFYEMKNELIALGLINRENEYHFTQEEKLKILELYSEGKNISQIMRLTKYRNREYLIKYLIESGIDYKKIQRPTTKESTEKKQIIYDMHLKGLRNSQIARQLNVSSGFVSFAIKEMKIKNGIEDVPNEMKEMATKIKAALQNGSSWNDLVHETGFTLQHLRLCVKWTEINNSR
ncbi:MAG: hypothetical protein JSR97_02515 [Verrucomicrobia bacterium]|nr:hypothetical protein [Verrucomicrobiota bacterium]